MAGWGGRGAEKGLAGWGGDGAETGRRRGGEGLGGVGSKQPMSMRKRHTSSIRRRPIDFSRMLIKLSPKMVRRVAWTSGVSATSVPSGRAHGAAKMSQYCLQPGKDQKGVGRTQSGCVCARKKAAARVQQFTRSLQTRPVACCRRSECTGTRTRVSVPANSAGRGRVAAVRALNRAAQGRDVGSAHASPVCSRHALARLSVPV